MAVGITINNNNYTHVWHLYAHNTRLIPVKYQRVSGGNRGSGDESIVYTFNNM